MRRACGWCGKVLPPSDEPPAPGLPADIVSHGMCEPCLARCMAEIDADAGKGAGSGERLAQRGGTRSVTGLETPPGNKSGREPGAGEVSVKDPADSPPVGGCRYGQAGRDAGRQPVTLVERRALLAPDVEEE